MVFQEGYLIVYTLKVTIYCQKHDNILISREKKHLIFEKLEGYPNLAWAEFLPPWAFLDFFCKISTPGGIKFFYRASGRLKKILKKLMTVKFLFSRHQFFHILPELLLLQKKFETSFKRPNIQLH